MRLSRSNTLWSRDTSSQDPQPSAPHGLLAVRLLLVSSIVAFLFALAVGAFEVHDWIVSNRVPPKPAYGSLLSAAESTRMAAITAIPRHAATPGAAKSISPKASATATLIPGANASPPLTEPSNRCSI